MGARAEGTSLGGGKITDWGVYLLQYTITPLQHYLIRVSQQYKTTASQGAQRITAYNNEKHKGPQLTTLQSEAAPTPGPPQGGRRIQYAEQT